MRIFETFKPENELVRRWVSYYYLDVADDAGYFNKYTCYPHFNSTISLYKSHIFKSAPQHSYITFKKGAESLQIFGPIRTELLTVTQTGPVHKIGIVFNALGINQFVKGIEPGQEKITCDFFSAEALSPVFATFDTKIITSLIDGCLLKKFTGFNNHYLEKALEIIHTSFDDISIEALAESKLGISRRQLTRLFHKYLGVGVQKYRNIVRFRELMAYKLQQKETQNLTTLSYQAHYTDQSHFIKSCKQLTGLSPRQFFNDGQIIGSEDTFWNFKGK